MDSVKAEGGVIVYIVKRSVYTGNQQCLREVGPDFFRWEKKEKRKEVETCMEISKEIATILVEFEHNQLLTFFLFMLTLSLSLSRSIKSI